MKLWYDTETRSRIALTHGTAKYATDGEIIIATWAIDDGEPQYWDVLRRPNPPMGLILAIEEADEIWCHNAYFDRTMSYRAPWFPKEHAPMSKWRCTMAQLLAHGLPGGLDHACEIFKVDASEAKLEGKEFIKLFCKPNKNGTYNDAKSHPEEWKAFLKYATRDIPAMRAVHKKCVKWNYGGVDQFETKLWHLDQTINDRGIAVDVDFAAAAVRATTEEQQRLGDRVFEMTNECLDRATQRDKLLQYMFLEYGVSLPDLKQDTVERRLEDPELPEHVKELLRIRLSASKSSTSKYKRVMQMNVAGRMYGTLQYCAANRTGRWGGRGVQPQNLKRPTHKQIEIDAFIAACKVNAEDLITDDIMGMASSSMRGVFVAAPGRRLVTSDLSNIEGRKLAWLAGEDWKLQAFRDFDAGIGKDLYILAYARAFDIRPEDVDDEMRQIGKVMELALGYQGGVGAFVSMVTTYGIDLDILAERAWDTIPGDVLKHAQGFYEWAKRNRRTLGLDEKVFVVCQSLVSMWRAAHPQTVALWESVENAAKNAILNPNIAFQAGRCEFERKGAWLRVKLPSGRFLCYPYPRIDADTITYMGINVYNKRWHRISTYGGKFVENIDQASSRDVIAWAMPHVEAAGYPIVLSVHDELVTEPPDSDEFNDIQLSAILATNPPWAQGIPLAAKGFTAYRYKKG